MTTTPSATDDLARNTAVMAAGTLLSRLTGFGRVFALAYALGLTHTRLTDTYNLANTTPNIVYELVIGGVLSATLLPVFVRLWATEDEDAAWEAVSAVVSAVMVTVLAVSVLFAVAAPLVIRLYTFANETGSADDQQVVATFLLRLFAPQVLLYGAVTVSTALLHARRRFAVPMFAPVLNNLVVIAVLLALPHVVDDISLPAMRDNTGGLLLLGLGTTAGVAAMAAIQAAAAARVAGRRLRFVWKPGHEAVRTVLRLSGWTVGFTVANQLAYWVVLVLANRVRGDLSAYQAAYQYFFLLPHGVIAVSVMSALQPDLAERWSAVDVDGFRTRLVEGLRRVTAVLVPAAVGYIALGRPIVRLLLEHGNFSAHDTDTVADVLALMALGLPAFSAYLLLIRAFQAMQEARAVFFLYMAENAVNIALALALYPAFGVRGLALAFALAYAVGTLMAVLVMRRRSRGIDARVLATAALRVLIASAVMGAVAFGISELIGGDDGLRLVARVGAGVVAGVTVYVLAARLLGIDELTALLRFRRR